VTDEQLANLRRLADKATTPPWRVATDADVGDNWLVCMGGSIDDNHTYYVTTDHVHASELEGDARTDAEFVAACRTAVPKLLDTLAAATQRAETAEAKLAAIPVATLRHLESEQPIDTNDPNEMRWCEVDEWLRTLECREAQP